MPRKKAETLAEAADIVAHAKYADEQPVPLAFHYKPFSPNHPGMMQVRRSDWDKDAYKTIDAQSWQRFSTMLKRFDIEVIHDGQT